MWENGGMETHTKTGPSPWLAPGLSAIGIVFFIAWAYIQIRLKQEPGADPMVIALNIFITLILWAVLIVASWRNFSDARRAKPLTTQVKTITEAKASLEGRLEQLQSDLATERASRTALMMVGYLCVLHQEASAIRKELVSIEDTLKRSPAIYATIPHPFDDGMFETLEHWTGFHQALWSLKGAYLAHASRVFRYHPPGFESLVTWKLPRKLDWEQSAKLLDDHRESLHQATRSLSEYSARSREQSERNRDIIFHAKGLPSLPPQPRSVAAAEPARMARGRASGVLRQ
jgi:hypothetical protein